MMEDRDRDREAQRRATFESWCRRNSYSPHDDRYAAFLGGHAAGAASEREALGPWLRHMPHCNVVYDSGYACSCGLDAALAGPQPTAEEGSDG